MMSQRYSPENIITFNIKGEGRNIIIFSPFFPFSNKMIENMFSDMDLSSYKLIFTNLITSSKIKIKDYNIENLINIYSKLINSLDNDSKIYLIGFGIFSILFSNLLLEFNNKISYMILFEPDLSNSVLTKIFDTIKKPFFKYKYIVNFYLNNKKENNLNISKKNLKYLKFYYYNIKNHLEKNKVLKELINLKDKISIYWKVMEKESWPLSQILQIEYNLQVYSINENIYDSMQKGDELIKNKIKEILK
jgi:hypothetical protein